VSITNHLLAGAAIAYAIDKPLPVLLLAFASHFVMDALPHFGYPGNKGYGEAMKHRLSYVVAGTDAVLALIVLTALRRLIFYRF
jgi:hypothetical protein